MCGIAGALYVPQVGIINPSEMSPAASIEMAIWAAVGGRATLIGPIIGAFFVNGAKSWFTVAFPSSGCISSAPVHRRDPVPAARHRRPVRLKARQEDRGEGMTPDLMEEGAQRRAGARGAPHHRWPVRRPQRRYGRVVQPGELDLTHGSILYLDDITVSFDGFKALNKLSLDISVGEMRCIIGPNGAGKTTMMDVITGKTRPDSGTAFFGSTIDLLRLREPRSPKAASAASSRSPRCSSTSPCSRTWNWR
jgi:hypothetical protein